MTARSPITGGCFCGKVRYQITRLPAAMGICHCRSCRRIAGAESVGWAVNDADALELTSGKPRVFRSSKGIERTFCDTCGSTLTYRSDDRHYIDVTLATLDDPEFLPPTKETWCRDRVSWNQLNDALIHYERGSS